MKSRTEPASDPAVNWRKWKEKEPVITCSSCFRIAEKFPRSITTNSLNWFGFENETPINFPYFPANGYWPENGESDPGIPDNAPTNVISCYGYTSELPTGSYRWKVKAISEVNNITGVDEASGESEWLYFNID